MCQSCNKEGHLAKVCHSNNQERSAKECETKTLWVDTEKSEHKDPQDAAVFQLVTGPTSLIFVDMELNGKEVRMELDTGAAVSLFLEHTKERLFLRAPLQSPEVALRTYTLWSQHQ